MDGSRCVRRHLCGVNGTLQTIFLDTDVLLTDPRGVADLHAVPSTADASVAAALAAVAPAGVPPVAPGANDLASVRRAAHAGGVAVDVFSCAPGHTVVDRDARGGRRVVLFCAAGRYSPAAAIVGDRVSGLYPTRPRRLRYVAEAPPPTEVPAVATPADWTARFLSADVQPTAAAPWASWPDVLSTLDGPWGRAPQTQEPVRVGELTDPRLDDLAAWADWHRTAVRVAYEGAHFRLLPDLCAPAHGGAKASRAVYVEVGDDGGRLWHEPGAAKGWRAYNEFFVGVAAAGEGEDAE